MSQPSNLSPRRLFFTKMALAGVLGLAAIAVHGTTHDDNLVRVAAYFALLIAAGTVGYKALWKYLDPDPLPNLPRRQDREARVPYELGDYVDPFPSLNEDPQGPPSLRFHPPRSA